MVFVAMMQLLLDDCHRSCKLLLSKSGLVIFQMADSFACISVLKIC
jgi:hypothetical protein